MATTALTVAFAGAELSFVIHGSAKTLAQLRSDGIDRKSTKYRNWTTVQAATKPQNGGITRRSREVEEAQTRDTELLEQPLLRVLPLELR